MKLTEKDIEYFKRVGHLDSDIPQLRQAAIQCKLYDRNDNKISATKAIEMIGREGWLSGISRAAFHWTACRGEGDSFVYFDCSDMLNKIFRQ